MLGHGQVEGLGERYGMEFRRPTRDEQPNAELVVRHERELFPLFRQRRRFAASQDFRLYDAITGAGGVDEDVFAYSNGSGAARSLVVYHDRFASTAGRIRVSVAFAVKGDDGERRLERTVLADALGLSGDPEAVVSFRDPRTGYGLVATIRELRERGLELRLAAYESHVFTEIEEHPSSDLDWRLLAERLGGAGAASLDDALAAIRYEAVHEPLRAALAALPDLDVAAALLAEAASAAGADPAGVATAVDRLSRLAERRAVGSERRAVQGEDIEGAARLGWAALAWLPGTAPARRAAVDELRLTWPLARALAARGMDGEAARAAADRARFLAGVPLPGEVGGQGKAAAGKAAALVDAWVADPELRAAIGHHTWEGVDYVSAEGWAALASATAALAALADPDVKAVRAATALARRLMRAARDAGYRVDGLRAALTPVPGRRKPVQVPAAHSDPRRARIDSRRGPSKSG
jgi:hypothetical protein